MAKKATKKSGTKRRSSTRKIMKRTKPHKKANMRTAAERKIESGKVRITKKGKPARWVSIKKQELGLKNHLFAKISECWRAALAECKLMPLDCKKGEKGARGNNYKMVRKIYDELMKDMK
jgi:hypothetical protein